MGQVRTGNGGFVGGRCHANQGQLPAIVAKKNRWSADDQMQRRATHSHVRRGLAEGMDGDELEQVALLAVTTLGWPKAMRALSWIRDITRPAAE
jgi:alkylhydroperoxidase/carboxymuconolactone decarboxylase family protein YurZ